MATRALGLIEVKGMLSAIVAGDAALKAADVNLLGNRRIRGGLTTVELFGDVSAIKSAVEAGVNAVKDSNNLISSHVIARLDEQVENMLLKDIEARNKKKQQSTNEPKSNETDNPVSDQEDMSEAADVDDTDSIDEAVNEASSIKVFKPSDATQVGNETVSDESEEDIQLSEDYLKALKVTELRSLAYKLNITSMEKAKIKFANKRSLIEALSNEGGNN